MVQYTVTGAGSSIGPEGNLGEHRYLPGSLTKEALEQRLQSAGVPVKVSGLIRGKGQQILSLQCIPQQPTSDTTTRRPATAVPLTRAQADSLHTVLDTACLTVNRGWVG
jgi:hypothetical protein